MAMLGHRIAPASWERCGKAAGRRRVLGHFGWNAIGRMRITLALYRFSVDAQVGKGRGSHAPHPLWSVSSPPFPRTRKVAARRVGDRGRGWFGGHGRSRSARAQIFNRRPAARDVPGVDAQRPVPAEVRQECRYPPTTSALIIRREVE